MKRDVVDYLRYTGATPSNINMTISGASDQLQATREALAANYVVAIIIYLLLVAIFTHWGYPLLIMTTIPLGVAGGILGLWLCNLGSDWLPLIGMNSLHLSFDMIAMLGFLILMGTVVNNPILIVHQAMTTEVTMARARLIATAVFGKWQNQPLDQLIMLFFFMSNSLSFY